MRKLALFTTIIIVLVLLFSVQGCSNEKDTTVTKTQHMTSSNEKSNLVSYDKYKDIYKELCENFKVDGFTKSGSTEYGSLVAIEEQNSFGKRQFLTLDGSQNTPETQECISYEEDNSKYVLFLDFIYLDKEIDNDLIYFNGHFIEKYINDDIVSKFDDSILSFHNTLIKVTLISKCDKSAASENIVGKTMSKLVDFLKKFE